MALLEASTKLFSAIHKRLHRAQAEEFRILKRLNRENLPAEYPYDVVGGSRTVFAADFDDDVSVSPVSDPNIPSSAHKVALAQLISAQAAQSPPGMFDQRAINRYMLDAAGVQEIDQLMPEPEKAEPRDPVSDVVAATQGKPVKAFPGQDHMAYIGVFTAFISDPSVQSNQLMAPAMQVLGAAIREHQVQQYVEQMAGLVPQAMAADLTFEQASAQAAQQILQANQMAAQQGMGEDPMMVAAKAEQLKGEAAMRKVELDAAAKAAEASLKSRGLDIEERGLELKRMIAGAQSLTTNRTAELNARVKMATTTVANLAQLAKPAPQPKEPPRGKRKEA